MIIYRKGNRERPARGNHVTNLRGRRFLPLLCTGFLVAPIFADDVRIEPAVDVVPANHLKFYLHFPEPMERGDVFRYLRLARIDEEGNEVAEVPEPFREVELWDETFTRLTLWFHPGRQKPGVNLNVEIGPILEEGKRYRLEISDTWKTESGVGVSGSLDHEFVAGSYDGTQPNPYQWDVGRSTYHLGKATGRVVTDELLDPQSALKRVRIFLNEKETIFRVVGRELQFGLGQGSEFRLTVQIDPRVEDLAGNSVARPFNLDIDKNPGFEEKTETIELTFKLPHAFP